MNDKKLHQQFKKFGADRRKLTNKLIGMLPNIYKRKIYEKEGFDSIFEYAAKLAGLSKEQVKRALSLHVRFEEMPTLKKMLVEGEVSMHKLARVASIATPQNEEELAGKVQILPQSSIETLVRDEKTANQDDLQKPLFEDKFVRAHKLELSAEVQEKLKSYQEKGIDINKLLMELLEKHEQKIKDEKEKISREAKPTKSKYVKKEIRTVLYQEYGDKCAEPSCKKKSEEMHHSNLFALSKVHDPYYLAPFCKEHHQIAQTINVKSVQERQKAVESG